MTVEKLGRAELIALVEKFQRGEIDEAVEGAAVEALRFSTGHPNVLGLIFYPEEPEPTAEEVVDQALAYRPIEL
jgi:hypothetical protein